MKKTALALGASLFALTACDEMLTTPTVSAASHQWDYQCGNQWMKWNFLEGGATVTYTWQSGSIMKPTTRSPEGDTRVVRQDGQTFIVSGSGSRWIFINEGTNNKTICNRNING